MFWFGVNLLLLFSLVAQITLPQGHEDWVKSLDFAVFDNGNAPSRTRDLIHPTLSRAGLHLSLKLQS